jgi:polysaccharide biosynthesis/export protein
MSEAAVPMVLSRNESAIAVSGTRSSVPARSLVPACVALASAVAMAACSPVPSLPPAPMEPALTTSSTNLPPYHIQVGDVLEVRLLLNPELNEEVTVRPDGHVSTTAVSDMLAYGRTPAELADGLRGVYAHDLQKPRLSVVVKSFAPTRIYVGGEVTTPGEFVTVGPTLTLSQAIARAGGTKLSSDDTKVFVIRRGPSDKPEFLSTSWKDLRQGRDPNADVRLAPYDVVYVPKLGIAEVYQFYNQYIGQFANPSFGFSYLLNPEVAGSTVVTQPAAH